jgi:hypothetical protein
VIQYGRNPRYFIELSHVSSHQILFKATEESPSTHKLNEEIKRIMDDIRDPLLPVRAHGLIALRYSIHSIYNFKFMQMDFYIFTYRKLVLRKDPEVKKYATKVLDIFWSQINDEDSYVVPL